MTPQQVESYRANTKTMNPYRVTATAICPCCKTRRSMPQFDGKATCRKCRGVK